MKSKADLFFENLKGKKVAFIGAGVSHKKLIEIFSQEGAVVTLCDKKTLEGFGDYAQTLKNLGVNLSLGENYLEGLKNQDMIMRTPGFEFFTKELQDQLALGVQVTSEMELFFQLCPCKIYAVTGSDGKTTTTTLISEMLRESGRTVHLGGNIGKALLPIVRDVKEDDVAVVELSSFQLISMKQSPDVAVVTNVTPNHLDHHKDMQEYIDAKRNILIHQPRDSKAVLGYENDVSRNMEDDVKGKCVFFTRLTDISALPDCGYIDADGMLCVGGAKIVDENDVALRGKHNLENLLAAFCAVNGDVPYEVMTKVAKEFKGVEHRIEPVRTLNGVQWFNDSIASSPTRTIAGLRSFPQKICIIAGGYDKKIPYEPLAQPVIENVKLLVVMGQTGPAIEKVVREHPDFEKSGIKILRADSMEQAVQLMYENTQPGDIVSLSPASASFDFYPNFEVRGRHFKELVNKL
ncbi:MAG: UDP-N-acetylmuramoyl-L-alanine--D-glutamate ligase [Oscillospiraceae bacterium]|nr:UDP-N-acetylmuramoyl-L-alanine--D-glutamate ligase [Oscillospiraceae bacterium]